MKSIWVLPVVLTLLLSACGGGSDDVDEWTVITTRVVEAGEGIEIIVEFIGADGELAQWIRLTQVVYEVRPGRHGEWLACWAEAVIGNPLPECARYEAPLPMHE